MTQPYLNIDEFLIPNNAQEGDIIILTKPLGTQVVVNLKEWKSENDQKYQKVISQKIASDKDIEEMSDLAIQSMGKLNKNAATLVRKYKAGACTDVTGFGILGHLENLAEAQRESLELNIDTLPVIKKTQTIESEIQNFNLLKGYSAETSGGLMCMIKEKDVQGFMNDLKNQYGEKSWVIGQVIRKNDSRKAVISKNPEIVEVDSVFT